MELKNKPKIGFIPHFGALGDTYPLIEIAKYYRQLGGKAVFFSHGGKYEKLVKDMGFKTIKIIPEYFLKKYYKILFKLQYAYQDLKFTPEKKISHFFDKEYEDVNIEMIDKEIKAFQNEKVKVIFTNLSFTSHISARVNKIPLVLLTSGIAIPPYFQFNRATFPEDYDNYFTRFIPKLIKNRLTNLYILHCKWGVKGFNRLAKKYQIPTIKRFLDLFSGDYTLMPDCMEFLELEPTVKFPAKNFIGPILLENIFKKQIDKLDFKIEQHLKRPGKSILLYMGSVGDKILFMKILNILNKTDYNVIAIYTTILNEKKLPKLNDNILLKKFVSSIKKVNENVDLAIIHGGRGTVYTTAYSGKPAIGIPMHFEQNQNIDNLVRYGSTLKLSKNFQEKQLIYFIKKIFNNYSYYFNNANCLAKKLPTVEGASNAVNRLIEIFSSTF